MQVGMLTAPFGGDDLDTVVGFAKCAGFDSLELAVGAKHCDVYNLDAGKMKATVAEAGLKISSLAMYGNISDGNEDNRKAAQDMLAKSLQVCSKLGVDVLCCGAGLPPAGMSREQTIAEISAPFYRKFAKKAAAQGSMPAFQFSLSFRGIRTTVDEPNLQASANCLEGCCPISRTIVNNQANW